MISREFIYSSAVNFLQNTALFAKAHPVRTSGMFGLFAVGLFFEWAASTAQKPDEADKCDALHPQWIALAYWIPSYSSRWGMSYIQPIALSILGSFGLSLVQRDPQDSEKDKYNNIGRLTSGISKIVNVAIISFTISQNYSKNAGIAVATVLGVLSAFNSFKEWHSHKEV